MSYTLVENDTGVQLQIYCTEGDPPAVVDLTDHSAILRWRVDGDGEVTERPMTMLNPDAGIVSYSFAAGEITASEMEFEVVITDPQGKTRTSLTTFRERVRERLA